MLLLVILFLKFQLARSQQCSPGQYYHPLFECMNCPAGSYSDDETQCKLCPMGKTGSNDKATSKSMCNQECALGKFGQVSRDWTDVEFSSCSNCAAGKYSNVTGLASCYSCPSDKYTIGESSTSVDSCFGVPSGYYVNSKNKITACNGIWGDQVYLNGFCQSCPAGTYFLSGQFKNHNDIQTNQNFNYYGTDVSNMVPALCVSRCPTGTKAMWPYGSTPKCQCPTYEYPIFIDGEFSSCVCNDNAYRTPSGECKTCPSGTRMIGGGCEDCPVNTFSYSDSTTCTTCPGDRPYSGEGSSMCYRCPGGQHLLYGKCVECNPGEYSMTSGCSPCALGSYQPNSNYSCLPCPIGKTTNATGAQDISQCSIECGVGKFAQIVKSNINNGNHQQSICSNCAVGKYSNVTGLTSCYSCPSDKNYTIGESSASVDSCFGVPSGYYVNSNNKITACQSTYQVYLNGSCHYCQEGTAFFSGQLQSRWDHQTGTFYYYGYPPISGMSDVSKMLPALCVSRCPAGSQTYISSSWNGNSYVIYQICQCVNGYPDLVGKFLSCECNDNAYRAASGECRLCPEASTKVNGSCVCNDNAYRTPSGECKTCPQGTRMIGGGCEDCPVNTFSYSGSTTCTACPSDRPYSDVGSSMCYRCPGGQYFANDKCNECSPGKYSVSFPYPSCNKCPAGSYLPGSNFSCLPCPIGKTTDTDGAQDISQCNYECDYGEFGEITDSFPRFSICSICSTGKYSNIKGATSCVDCPIDRKYTLPEDIYGDTYQVYKKSSIDSCFALPSGYYLDAFYGRMNMGNYPSLHADEIYPVSCSAYGMVYNENGNSCRFCPNNQKFFSGGTMKKFNDRRTSYDGYFYSNDNLLFPVPAFCVSSCPNGTLPVKINNIETCQCPSKSHPSFVNGEYTCECDFNARRVSSGKCKFCKRGKIMVNGECENCPVNTYANRGDLHCSTTPLY